MACVIELLDNSVGALRTVVQLPYRRMSVCAVGQSREGASCSQRARVGSERADRKVCLGHGDDLFLLVSAARCGLADVGR